MPVNTKNTYTCDICKQTIITKPPQQQVLY